MATGRTTNVQFPLETGFFCLSPHQDQLWGPFNLLSYGMVLRHKCNFTAGTSIIQDLINLNVKIYNHL